ncbi:hypothetical protein E2562_035680 [Oryza meyeriana var. granulata]|uniref:Uncharacterized protein n=1 Tax=Oryza meyeriana var. granulata TaxID=110450 RepID=A0A6G1CXB4_9ORYZ|nr:hypothetical protein E2562_035680 [Oryza meyeriana var. granulata]
MTTLEHQGALLVHHLTALLLRHRQKLAPFASRAMEQQHEKTAPVTAGWEGARQSSLWRVVCWSKSGIRWSRTEQARRRADLSATPIEIRVVDSRGIEMAGGV